MHSKQSARLSLQTSELAPYLHPHASVAPPPTFGSKKGETHKLKGEGVGEEPYHELAGKPGPLKSCTNAL